MRGINKNNKGDTIIEVLVCLAILGFVMTLAYTISSRSLQTIRRAQERVEALKIAEGQIELLKDLQKNNNYEFIRISDRTTGPNNDDPFCINPSTGAVTEFNVPPDTWNADLSIDNLGYPAGCKDLSATGTGTGFYNIAVVPPESADGGPFKVYVRWLRAGGGVNDQVTMEYRLYATN